MIYKTAWKNVWRNRTRSLVVITSITIGIFAGVFAVGLMNGTIEQRVDAALNQEMAHIQVNREQFRENFEINLTINNADSVSKLILRNEDVTGVAQRLLVNAIANTASKSVGIQLNGIDPEAEKKILSLDKTLIPGTGSYFEDPGRHNLAYIGQDLAKDLNIIRFSLDEAAIDSLASGGIPPETLSKLDILVNKQFPGEKAFSKEVQAALSRTEVKKYGADIMKRAWHFRDRSKITMTFLDKNLMQTGAMFRIAGIYDVNNSVFEKSQVFILRTDLERLTGIDANSCHQILVKVNDRDEALPLAKKLRTEMPGLQVESWKEISPDLAMMVLMVQKFNGVFLLIILAALSFGIVNTMLMVVLERTKELGMLTAIGMNKRRVFSMIMAESVFLSLVGGVAGMVISRLFIISVASKGISISSVSEGFEAMGFSSHIYPSISGTFFITVTILIIITGILSAIYPAIKALKLDPADALRTE